MEIRSPRTARQCCDAPSALGRFCVVRAREVALQLVEFAAQPQDLGFEFCHALRQIAEPRRCGGKREIGEAETDLIAVAPL